MLVPQSCILLNITIPSMLRWYLYFFKFWELHYFSLTSPLLPQPSFLTPHLLPKVGGSNPLFLISKPSLLIPNPSSLLINPLRYHSSLTIHPSPLTLTHSPLTIQPSPFISQTSSLISNPYALILLSHTSKPHNLITSYLIPRPSPFTPCLLTLTVRTNIDFRCV